MPKMTDRERLAKIEADQHNLAQEAETVRRGLRAHYGRLTAELPVERLSEREFREVLTHAIRVGGGAAIAALKGLAAIADTSKGAAGSKPSAGRKRTSPPQGGARPGGTDVETVVHP